MKAICVGLSCLVSLCANAHIGEDKSWIVPEKIYKTEFSQEIPFCHKWEHDEPFALQVKGDHPITLFVQFYNYSGAELSPSTELESFTLNPGEKKIFSLRLGYTDITISSQKKFKISPSGNYLSWVLFSVEM